MEAGRYVAFGWWPVIAGAGTGGGTADSRPIHCKLSGQKVPLERSPQKLRASHCESGLFKPPAGSDVDLFQGGHGDWTSGTWGEPPQAPGLTWLK
jgi:hypothetical protein